MSFLASWIDSLLPGTWTRKGSFECSCGAVKGELCVPVSSWILIDQTSALCHCQDCIGFVRACAGGNHVLENHAAHLVNFYKSDLTIVKGKDKIRRVRLYEKTVLIRTYCDECGTPLGADVDSAPITLLYQQLINSGPIFLPTIVLGRKFAPPDARPYYGIPVANEIYSISFLAKVIGRVLIGFLFGKGYAGGLCNLDYSDIPVGIDTIQGKGIVSNST